MSTTGNEISAEGSPQDGLLKLKDHAAFSQLPSIANTKDRLFCILERKLKDQSILVRRACLIGFSGGERLDLLSLLSELNLELSYYLSDSDFLFDHSNIPLDVVYILLMLDEFPTADVAVLEMMQFRIARPDCRVILVSKGSLGDDLGSERKAICDATLSWPISLPRLRSCIEKIEDRNLI